MQTALRPAFGIADHPVWQRLDRYDIGPADAALDFTGRLARENGWSRRHADRVLAEYKRFAFLAVTTGQPLTPSDAVDQAWHLHLTYTQDYWGRFCPDVLGRALHHGPTAGGAAETHRFFDQYARTLAAYRAAFGEAPPADLWPAAAQRLRDDPRARRVHPRDFILVPRRLLWLALVVLLVAVACVVPG